MTRLETALALLLTTPATVKWLATNDPQALAQAYDALVAAARTPAAEHALLSSLLRAWEEAGVSFPCNPGSPERAAWLREMTEVALSEVTPIDDRDAPEDVREPYGNPAFRSWLDRVGAAYYAAPRESFSLRAAKERALAEGKRRVFVENLS